MKINKNIYYAVAAVGAGYGAYWLFNKLKSGGFGKSTPNLTESEVTQQVNTALSNMGDVDPYKQKVVKLQVLLGVEPDGAFGNISTGALKGLYLGSLPYGAVSASNITKYIDDIEQKKTPKQKSVATAKAQEQTQGTNSARVALARKIYNAATKNGSFKKSLTWKDNPVTLGIYKKDALGGYVKTSQTKSLTNGATISYDVMSINSQGFLRLMFQKINNVEYYIFVSPYSVTVF